MRWRNCRRRRVAPDADLIFGGYCEVSPAGRRRIHTPWPDHDRVLAQPCSDRIHRTSNRLWGILTAVRFTRATACGLPRG